MTTAIIIGGGIAGPAAAMALQRAGLSPAVFEAREPAATERGSWLTLQANGMDALGAIGAQHCAADLGFDTTSMRFLNGSGKVLGTLPMEAGGEIASQTLPRATLYRALREEAVARGIEVCYARRLVEASAGPGGVTAKFADGSTATADVLIGADGVRSTVRSIVDPDAPHARYLPVLNLGAHVPGLDTGTPVAQWQMVFGTRCFFAWVTTPAGGTVWFANPPRPVEPRRGELERVGDRAWRAELRSLLAGDSGPAGTILDATPGPLEGWATYDLPPVPRWFQGRIGLIGDAIHATAPSSGQGASLALEDAVVLAQCLRDVPTVEGAFTAFEGLRRGRVERIVRHGNRTSSSKAAGPIARRVRDLVLPLVFRAMARDGGSSTHWITGHHIAWDEPVGAGA